MQTIRTTNDTNLVSNNNDNNNRLQDDWEMTDDIWSECKCYNCNVNLCIYLMCMKHEFVGNKTLSPSSY